MQKGKNEFTGKADNGDVQHLVNVMGLTKLLYVITFPAMVLMEGFEPSPISADRN